MELSYKDIPYDVCIYLWINELRMTIAMMFGQHPVYNDTCRWWMAFNRIFATLRKMKGEEEA